MRVGRRSIAARSSPLPQPKLFTFWRSAVLIRQTDENRAALEQEQSFPLTSIFQLMTFCSALVVCIDYGELSEFALRRLSKGLGEFYGPFLASGLVGLLIGVLLGLGQIHKWRGVLLCGTSGAMVGMLILAIYIAPARPAQAFTASLVPLVTTVLIRCRRV